MIVVDASVLAPALADDGARGDQLRHRLEGGALTGPELLDVEVLSVLRRALLHGELEERRAVQALTDLIALPLRRVPHRSLLARAWKLRHNLTSYDALYVAVAESTHGLLLTADRRMAGAPGIRCDVEVV